MRTLARVGFLTVVLAGLGSLTVAAAATTAKLPDIPQSYLLSPEGRSTPLRPAATYQASQFPIALRLTPPNRSWLGAQWKSGSEYFRGGGGPPHFGWVAVDQGSPAGIPRGLLTIMTAYARTPSVAATVNVLRTRGRGATYQDASPVKLAGFSGIQFDGQIVGARNSEHIGHYFIPFSPRSHAARYYPDEYPVYGEVFRVIVLNVRGKTVVVFIENVALPADQFPSFLTRANQILNTLRFPG